MSFRFQFEGGQVCFGGFQGNGCSHEEAGVLVGLVGQVSLDLLGQHVLGDLVDHGTQLLAVAPVVAQLASYHGSGS